jgi:hypothetical protein
LLALASYALVLADARPAAFLALSSLVHSKRMSKEVSTFVYVSERTSFEDQKNKAAAKRMQQEQTMQERNARIATGEETAQLMMLQNR